MSDGNGLFGLDKERFNSGYALEHTAHFGGTEFVKVVDAEYRTQLLEEHNNPAFVFNKQQENIKPGNEQCTHVDIDFGGQISAFDYDDEKNHMEK